MSRGLTASAALCAGLLLPGRACAQDPHPTLLAYKAPADCPAVGDFQRSVERRSTRIHFVDEGSHDRELSISLRKDRDFTVGELRLIEHDGTLRQRSVRFTTCAEAIEGLALIATVSLDPQALLETPNSASEAAPPPAAAEPVPPPAPPPPAPRHAKEYEPVSPLLHPTASHLETEIGAAFDAFFNAVPKVAFGGSAFMVVGSDSGHWYAPQFRLAITHVERLHVPELMGNASFALTLGTLSGCPLRIGGELLVFRPCASISGGALRSWGSETGTGQVSTRQYVSWGGVGLLTLRLGELVKIVGDAGVGVTLVRDHFGFEGAPTFWTTPTLYISTELGFSLPLP